MLQAGRIAAPIPAPWPQMPVFIVQLICFNNIICRRPEMYLPSPKDEIIVVYNCL
jgi:hypothetical protein